MKYSIFLSTIWLGWMLALVPIRADVTVHYDPVKLRGYGEVGGTMTFSTIDDQPGSLLTINCEDEDKAKLVLAKYLSDQQTLPGVDKIEFKARQWNFHWFRLGGISLPALEAKGQGYISAIRLGTKVQIAAARTEEGLVSLVDKELSGNSEPVVTTAEVKVPMWLDRWDQYGFHFYYWSGQVKPGEKVDAYDFRGDFTFARDNKVGMLFWNPLNDVMGADGQTNRTEWDWAEGFAHENNLPVAINLSASNFTLPNWIINRYRDQQMLPMPGYLGDSMSIANWRGFEGKGGELAWGATPARDEMLASLQASVRHFNKDANITSWLEPHGELAQGGDDFMGYGPATDATFREVLKEKYGTVDKVSMAWFGKADALKSWDDVKVPELATFLGWGPDALDLAGTWRVNFPEGITAAPECFTPTFDDSTWQEVIAPGDDRNFFLPKKFAVYRRTFDLPADWQAKNPKTWLYVWDLNVFETKKQGTFTLYLNGQKASEYTAERGNVHWEAIDVTSLLKPGANQVTMTLPNGFLGYRIYLSGTEPKQYPKLGEGLNTEWVDFVTWRQKTRVESVRRGMEMIREVDPNRGITLMAPSYAADGIKTLAQQYGGEFHDTGFMSGVWADRLPSWMRGSNLPYSLEPGGPAKNLVEFKNMLGFWHTEAIQQIDYFIHIGDVMWNPEIRKFFEENQPMIHLFGKYHQPKADLAFFWSTSADAMTGYPWTNDVNANLPSGWFCKGVEEELLGYCPRDGLTESDFERGNASAYKVIIDTNTSIMDEKLVKDIEKYVSDGGVFVTFVTSGRHSPTKPDSWPISRLTGYDVLTLEQYDENGHSKGVDPKDPNPPTRSMAQHIHPADGQTIYTTEEEWMKSNYLTGLRMKKSATDAQDLLLWKDGTVAVGMRKIDKGAIIEFGCKSDGQPWLGINIASFFPILKWAGVKLNPIDIAFDNPKAGLYRDYVFRSYVSNNGLFDVSVIFDESRTDALKATLTFKETKPETAVDIVTGKEYPVKNGVLADIALEPMQTRIFLTPRNEITRAPAAWFDLQRQWWKVPNPISKPLPKLSERFVHDLDEDWAWQPMEDKADPQPWLAADFDDSKWTKLGLGAWTAAPARQDVKHGFLRRKFTVPKEWDNGRVELWIQTTGPVFSDKGRVWLDGNLIQNWARESGISGLDFDGALKPGSTHVLCMEVQGVGQIVGVTGDAWLDYVPKPATTIDLAGQWTTCKDDVFKDTGTVTWPGAYEAKSLWRTVAIPAEDKGKTVMLEMEADRPFIGFVNGHMVKYSGNTPSINARTGINITPWINFGADNRIQLISHYGKGTMKRVALDFYELGAYP